MFGWERDVRLDYVLLVMDLAIQVIIIAVV